MTLTVRSATVTGATTKGSALTHAELDENFNHLSQSSGVSFLQSGTATPRTVEAELRDKYIYAANYGMAAGNTAAANTTAINAALAVAKTSTGQKTVVMPAGTIDINGFTPPGTTATDADTNGITLKGAGNGYQQEETTSGVATILKFAAGVTSGLGSTKTYGIYLDNSKHWCNFEDFAIDGNAAIDYGLRITSQITVKRVRATNCNGHGFRGQTMDSTFCEELAAVGNVGGGMLIDKATSDDSVNTTPNTVSFIGGVFNRNGTVGLEIEQLNQGRIKGVCQSNTSFGLKSKNQAGVAWMEGCDIDLWLEANGGSTDLYQILLDSNDASGGPSDNVFRGRIDPTGSKKTIHIVKGTRNRFLRTVHTAGATGAIDLDAGAVDTVFQNCVNSNGTTISSNITDSGTRNYEYGKWKTPTFAAGDFTSDVGSWTVAAGDVAVYSYCVMDSVMHLQFKINTTTVGTTPAELRIKIPGGFVAAQDLDALYQFSDNNGAWTVGTARVITSGGTTDIRLFPGLPGAGAWSNSTDLTYVYGQLFLAVA